MQSLKEILELSIQLIMSTAELFYQQKLEEGYQRLDQTLENITETINMLYIYRSECENFSFDEQKLVTTLTEAMKSMEEKDTILLADILQYELLVQMENIIENIK